MLVKIHEVQMTMSCDTKIFFVISKVRQFYFIHSRQDTPRQDDVARYKV